MGNMLRMCLNWKVLAGLAAVAAGVAIIEPEWLENVLPLLILAACPISMIVMMRSMGGGGPTPNLAPSPRRRRRPEAQGAVSALTTEQQLIGARLAELDDEKPRQDESNRDGAPSTSSSSERTPETNERPSSVLESGTGPRARQDPAPPSIPSLLSSQAVFLPRFSTPDGSLNQGQVAEGLGEVV